MGLLEDFLAAGLGYTISEVSKSHPVRDAINEHFGKSSSKNVTLEDLIDEYARRFEIYTSKNEFAHQLHQIAKRYEEYDYDRIYGDR